MKSQSKQGGIYIPSCTNKSKLFPLDKHPSNWQACQDAYEYTWMNDPDRLLVGLSEMQQLKLARSSGFCPQYRCQLDELGNADQGGCCPSGLCYSKVEFGGASFGACCFINGTFNAGQIIGYYDKLTSTPKPIYKPHRIILKTPLDANAESYERFMNAHWLDVHVVATQCAMTNTIADVITMILQENIQQWFQIYSITKKDCLLLHERFLGDDFKDKIVVYDDTTTNATTKHSNKQTHTHHDHHHALNLPSDRFVEKTVEFCYSNVPSRVLVSCSSEHALKHVMKFTAYTHWEDFMVPQAEDEQALNNLSRHYASLVSKGHNLAVNCYSGRGRTGSFASLVLGHKHKVSKHDQLVDLIVQLRERRDGLVETPRQYVFVSKMLGLSDPTVDAWHMGAYLENIHSDDRMVKSVLVLLICLVLIALPLRYVYHKKTI